MEVVVDLVSGSMSLSEPARTDAFCVRVLPAEAGDAAGTSALGAVAAVLGLHQAGRVEPGGDAFVTPDAVRALAAESDDAGPEWSAAFDEMLSKAADAGWVDEEGAIRAHLEWGAP